MCVCVPSLVFDLPNRDNVSRVENRPDVNTVYVFNEYVKSMAAHTDSVLYAFTVYYTQTLPTSEIQDFCLPNNMYAFFPVKITRC